MDIGDIKGVYGVMGPIGPSLPCSCLINHSILPAWYLFRVSVVIQYNDYYIQALKIVVSSWIKVQPRGQMFASVCLC